MTASKQITAFPVVFDCFSDTLFINLLSNPLMNP